MGKSTTPFLTSTISRENPRSLACWVVTNGRPGTEKQCIALARGLGFEPEIKRVRLKFPWSILPEKLWLAPLRAYHQDQATLQPPWPDVIISSGRAAAPVMAALYKKLGSHAPYIIHIQDPRLKASRFHKVIVPYHSDVKGENVIHIHGALHGVTPASVRGASMPWMAKWTRLLDYSKPPIGVFLGGVSRYYKITRTVSQSIAEQLAHLNKEGYPLLITASRRTPSFLLDDLRKKINPALTFIWDHKEENPYFAILESAAAYLVTTDSVSMISELCALGKPVYIIPLPPKPKLRPCRLERFRHLCEKKNFVKPFLGVVDIHVTHHTFNDLPYVVGQIKPDLQRYLNQYRHGEKKGIIN